MTREKHLVQIRAAQARYELVESREKARINKLHIELGAKKFISGFFRVSTNDCSSRCGTKPHQRTWQEAKKILRQKLGNTIY